MNRPAVRAGLAPDAFLSERLRCAAFALTAGAAAQVSADDLPRAPAFVTAKVAADDNVTLAHLQDLGFRVVDAALTFEGAVHSSLIPPPSAVRPAQDADKAAVMNIAGTAFHSSRFHLDPRVPNSVADAMKAEWAGNYFAGKRGTGMLVAAEAGKPVSGFLLYIIQADGSLIVDLIAVAPSAARRGYGEALMQAALAVAAPHALIVGTQAANSASCRLYQKVGLRMSKAQFVLHHHGLPTRESRLS